MSVLLRCAPLLAVANAVTLQSAEQLPTPVDAVDAAASSQIKEMLRTMKASPSDIEVQRGGCAAMQVLADKHREGPGPWGGRQVSTSLLEAGIGEVLAQGLLNAVTIEALWGRTSPGSVSGGCINAISGLTVQNDYAKGLALIRHAPHLWQAIVAYFKAFKSSSEVHNGLVIFAGLFGTPQPQQAAALEVEAGGIDFVMEYLMHETLKSDPEMFQRVFAAISDPVHEASGVVARAMANYGGRLRGIWVLVRALRWAKESGSTFHEGNGFGLLYEGVHDVGGVMEHDDANRTFAHAFVKAGLVEELVPIMREEPDDRKLQDMSCEAIKWITDDNVAVQTQLVEMGALELMAAALKKHSHPPVHEYCAVTIACSTALINFAATSKAWRDRLRSLGVYDTLDAEVLDAFPPTGQDDFIMRVQWFPNRNVYKLKAMLEPRTT